jgi:hypothetical protein
VFRCNSGECGNRWIVRLNRQPRSSGFALPLNSLFNMRLLILIPLLFASCAAQDRYYGHTGRLVAVIQGDRKNIHEHIYERDTSGKTVIDIHGESVIMSGATTAQEAGIPAIVSAAAIGLGQLGGTVLAFFTKGLFP